MGALLLRKSSGIGASGGAVADALYWKPTILLQSVGQWPCSHVCMHASCLVSCHRSNIRLGTAGTQLVEALHPPNASISRAMPLATARNNMNQRMRCNIITCKTKTREKKRLAVAAIGIILCRPRLLLLVAHRNCQDSNYVAGKQVCLQAHLIRTQSY